jgi:hypothetical protein
VSSEPSERSEKKGERLGGGHVFVNRLGRAFDAGWSVGVVRTAISDTRHNGMWAGATLHGTS